MAVPVAEGSESADRAGTVDVTMPDTGVEEGTTVVAWLKHPGEAVDTNEPICRVGWNGSTAEIGSPAGGVVRMLAVAAGSTVPTGTSLALIDTSLPVPPVVVEPEPEPEAAEPETRPWPEPVELEPEPQIVEPEPEALEPEPEPELAESALEPVPVELVRDAPRAEAPAVGLGGFVSPAVRRLAEQYSLDLTLISGSGRGGRVTLRDVRAQAGRADIRRLTSGLNSGRSRLRPSDSASKVERSAIGNRIR